MLLGREGGSSVSCALVWPKGGHGACASPLCSAEQHMSALEFAVELTCASLSNQSNQSAFLIS